MKNFFFLLLGLLVTGCTGQAQPALTATQSSSVTPITWNKAQNQKPAWYATPEAIRIADNLLLYQHDNGGWDKNTDMAILLTPEQKKDLASPAQKKAISTIDNKATFTQMQYLAKVYKTTGQEKYKESFQRGLDYLLKAQYENGGWPQFYPLKKGYYEYITFNDGAMIGVMELLRAIAQGNELYAFVDLTHREQAATAIEKGLEAILKTQITVNGQLTAWCAQHDHRTFAPQKARAYELVSISGMESVGIVEYLMSLDNPSPAVKRAVNGAISWLQTAKITGLRLDRIPNPAYKKGYDLVVVKDPSAPALLARFYEIGTNKPIFVGRDGLVHENLAEIEQERRSGYNWYAEFPAELVEKQYPAWKAKWGVRK
jgi:PelA/Pel-15E family pectate lyase